MDSGHISVLLREVVEGLNLQAGDVFLDGTLGSAGHSAEVFKDSNGQVKIIGLDMDEDALERARNVFKKLGVKEGNKRVTLVQGNFRNLDTILDSLKIKEVNKILLDIGLSSNQLDAGERGFSFQKEEPLQMTFSKNPEEHLTAEKIVNEWSEETLETIIKTYGEERYAYKIARGIVKAREEKPIRTTIDLVSIILASTPSSYHHRKIHPATRTFQALRIAVNDELQALQEGIAKGFGRLHQGGRMAVISFHSLEDRIVKHFFKELAVAGVGKLITKKPITPTEEEAQINRRSRSAKLRIIEKIHHAN